MTFFNSLTNKYSHLLKTVCSFCAAGRLVFENYLRTEYNDENVLFWLACENYKTNPGDTEMKADAKRIFNEFVQVGAPRQVWLLYSELRMNSDLCNFKLFSASSLISVSFYSPQFQSQLLWKRFLIKSNLPYFLYSMQCIIFILLGWHAIYFLKTLNCENK